MTIAASIVTYHTDSDELSQALQCLQQCGIARTDVVDNGSELRIKEICERYGACYLPSDNVGYGAAHNVALRRSIAEDTEYHLVMNSDILFGAEELRGMIERMEADAEIALLHPRIIGLDGADQYTARMLPTPNDLLLRRFMPSSWFKDARDRYLLKHIDHSNEISVAYVQGSFMLMRVKALREVGLFDERFFMYPEDIDLSRRMAKSHKVIYFPNAVVTHAHRAESYKSWRMTLVHIANMIKYFNKWGWIVDKQRADVNSRLMSHE